MSKLGKLILFLSSIVPMFIFLIILNINLSNLRDFILKFTNVKKISDLYFIFVQPYFSCLIIILLMILSFIILFLLFIVLKANLGYKMNEKIISIRENNTIEILNFYIIYIFTFVNSIFSDFSKANIQSLLVFTLLLIFIAFFFIKNNLIYINPTLYLLFKYNIYLVNNEKEETIIILSKITHKEMKKNEGTILSLHHIVNGIYIYK
ncbi:hypothetical protein Q3V94_00540 [Caloramator sp. CAR-1]|uniref:hypothetical protein n=1 Tax=Caloramator sp. CAR-1 TaxID=3062777 RepID=UPI0026E1A3BE|nr:hypothetical protein [Caloramator sp. CAR-1]MDO6353571.1 hypothetical protein [Caloramator sp. CAR-1]